MSRFASARQALAGANAHHLPALEKLEKAHKNTPTLKQLREHPTLGRNATARRLNHVFSEWNGYDRPWLDACSTTTCLPETAMVVRECDEFDDDYLDRNDDVSIDSSWCYDDDGTFESEDGCENVIENYLSSDDSCVTAWMCYMNCHAECLCGDAACGSFDASVCGTASPSVSPAPTTTFAPTTPYTYRATSGIGCGSYIHMDQGWWAGFVLQSGEVTLEQCAAAVWALNGVETSEGTCMGDYFYYESGGSCASRNARGRARPRPAPRGLTPRPPRFSRLSPPLRARARAGASARLHRQLPDGRLHRGLRERERGRPGHALLVRRGDGGGVQHRSGRERRLQ